jgi:3-hydroxyacyl-CoA dehydrogenase/enoyl-CoA hydratase/3-hydroxybutyryl-CoA epimerase/enoyl-CoA isomerase
MIYDGEFIKVKALEDDLCELVFDNAHARVNVLSQAALADLSAAVDALKNTASVAGLLVSSAKDEFILGADITEFPGLVDSGTDELEAAFGRAHKVFNDLEDLPFPTATAINGQAFGGGFEVCLATDFRVMSSRAKVGLPEVTLGIIPGWGGTIRLPRLIGAENALMWITTGKPQRSDAALKVEAVDTVVEPELLREATLDLLHKAISGDFDYHERRAVKKGPLKLNMLESMMAFESAKGMVFAKAGPNFPAPHAVVKLMQKAGPLGRDEAIKLEMATFAKLIKTDVCAALVGLFLNGQYLKKNAKAIGKAARPVKSAAVLGAGIMGGGISYQSASKGVPVVMKDINEPALQLGMGEAAKQLNKLVAKGRMTTIQMAQVVSAIRPSLKMADIADVDVVVEAVVENPAVKQAVLKEVEATVSEDTVIASNTSTISINLLAGALDKPERFCGMHFFNPVPVMPLVEVIRGEHTSDETIATVVAYASAIGKTPIVVNDCPGFLINRVLFPYFHGFNLLLNEGADFKKVDKVMEKFGWPMGPAYLQDVVGVDTCRHAAEVMAEGFPERMAPDMKSIVNELFEAKWLGQKNGKGFYSYEPDKKGKPRKLDNPEIGQLLAKVQDGSKEFSDEEIIARMMLPLCLETIRCLDEGIVASPAEADMAQIMGIGFPAFRGGTMRYIDTVGADAIVAMADKYAPLGPLYEAPDSLREMAAAGKKFFS